MRIFKFYLILEGLFIAEKDVNFIPDFSQKTLIAIRAPYGATLVVPDPSGSVCLKSVKRQYEIFLKSIAGSVGFFTFISEKSVQAICTDLGEILQNVSWYETTILK